VDVRVVGIFSVAHLASLLAMVVGIVLVWTCEPRRKHNGSQENGTIVHRVSVIGPSWAAAVFTTDVPSLVSVHAKITSFPRRATRG
jgi:hypothetical protein